jgi:hypothetical protein
VNIRRGSLEVALDIRLAGRAAVEQRVVVDKGQVLGLLGRRRRVQWRCGGSHAGRESGCRLVRRWWVFNGQTQPVCDEVIQVESPLGCGGLGQVEQLCGEVDGDFHRFVPILEFKRERRLPFCPRIVFENILIFRQKQIVVQRSMSHDQAVEGISRPRSGQ